MSEESDGRTPLEGIKGTGYTFRGGNTVKMFCHHFIPRHTIVAGYYGLALAVRVPVVRLSSVRSYFRFRTIT